MCAIKQKIMFFVFFKVGII